MARLEKCWHQCVFPKCQWVWAHLVKSDAADYCSDQNLCPQHSEQRARCTNYSRDWNAKNKAVREIDKSNEVSGQCFVRRKDSLPSSRPHAFYAFGEMEQSLALAYQAWDDAVEELSMPLL